MALFLLFIAVPLIEIALFIRLGSVLDLGWILLIVVLTALLGTWLVRQQGRGVLREIMSTTETLRDLTEPLAHGAMILFSGALLLTPGFFTDAVGFLLLIPSVRVAMFAWLRRRVVVHSASAQFRTGSQGASARRGPRNGYSAQSGPTIIDGEYTDLSVEPDTTPNEPSNQNERPQRPSGWTKD